MDGPFAGYERPLRGRRATDIHPGYHSDNELGVRPTGISMNTAPALPDFRRKLSFRGQPRARPRTPSSYPVAPTGYLSPPDVHGTRLTSRSRSPSVQLQRIQRSPSPDVLPPQFFRWVGSRSRTRLPESERTRASQSRLDRRAWVHVRASEARADSPRRRQPSHASSLGVQQEKGYPYRELRGMEFRLVKILPATMSAIKCEIIHASLPRPPRYVAISYAWGDVGDQKQIQLDGCSLSITSSLHGALESVRRKTDPILVWADALCIDQQNGEERTQQVQMMTTIYKMADSVAIWLGAEAEDSAVALDLLSAVAERADSPEEVTRLIASRVGKRDFSAAVSLFERDYWKRLWVVQEVLNARTIDVYCGRTRLPWKVLAVASDVFRRQKDDLDHYFPGGSKSRSGNHHLISQSQLSYSQVLVSQGPGSLLDLEWLVGRGGGSLLDSLRACRRKIASEPRDKVFGILGILTEQDRNEFPPDYKLSVKEVYTNVVDYLLATTESLDVLCEAIYFPLHTSSANLPSWVTDWSHIPQTVALGFSYDFSASRNTRADFQFIDDRRNKLEISAIYIDTIRNHGVAVGTLCATGDFCMAFLHWRALLLANWDLRGEKRKLVQEEFCRTLCLGQVPQKWDSKDFQWLTVCYHVFATLIRSRLPDLPLDKELEYYADMSVDVHPEARRRLIYEHCGGPMMGRSFCLTAGERMGMGTGFMAPGDIIVVPLGCSTPVILRPEGGRGEYRFVGDVYMNGYMYGRAIDRLKDGSKKLEKFVLH